MHSPTIGHLTVVKRILRHVKGSLSRGLSFHAALFTYKVTQILIGLEIHQTEDLLLVIASS